MRLDVNLASDSLNPATTLARLDWTRAFDLDGDGAYDDVLDPGAELPTPVDLSIDYPSSLALRVSGRLDGAPGTGTILTVADVTISGSVSFAASISDVDLKVGATTYDNARLAMFALRIEQPVSLQVDAITASITSGALGIAMIDLPDGTQYLGLKARDLAATVTGVPNLTGALTGVSIKINKATGPTTPAAL
jgi:hypothetical protein